MREAQLIENVYNAFSNVDKPQVIDGCDHCSSPEDRNQLLLSPLNNIDPELIRTYSASALTTVGNSATFKYLLPRVLELLTTHDDIISLTSSVICNMEKAGFRNWELTLKESALEIIHFNFEKHFSKQDMIEQFGEKYVLVDVDDYLLGFCIAGFDTTRLLEIFDRPENAQMKKIYITEYFDKIENNMIIDEIWVETTHQQQLPIINWINCSNNDAS